MPEGVEAHFGAGFFPETLPSKKQTPLVLRTAMRFAASEGTRLPPLGVFEIEIDRHLRLHLEGIPVCRVGNIDEPPPEERCRKALVGTGTMSTYIHFPESAPITAESEVRIYNAGPRSRTGHLVMIAQLTIPTPNAVIISAKIEQDNHGRYGLKLVGQVPKIAGGAGSVTDLSLRFRKGIFSGTCRDRHLDARFGATFVEGTHLSGVVQRTCTPSA